MCSDKETEARRIEYGQLYNVSDRDTFYKGSAEALTTEHSTEICLCTRDAFEFRSFTYQDQEVRVQFSFIMLQWVPGSFLGLVSPTCACREEG